MAEYHTSDIAKKKTILNCFLQIVDTSKVMADDVMPELLPGLDAYNLDELVSHCNGACSSLQAIVSYCKVSFMNAALTQEQRPQSPDSASHTTTEDETEQDDCNTSGARFKGLLIKEDFVKLSVQIRQHLDANEKFTISHCRPCEYYSFSRGSWSDHIRAPTHLRKMSSKFHTNVICICKRCSFALIASRRVAVAYMQYHVENCHDLLTATIAVDDCMKIVPISEINSNSNQFGGRQFKPTPKPTSSPSLASIICEHEPSAKNSLPAQTNKKLTPPISSDPVQAALTVTYKGTVLNDGFLQITDMVTRHLEQNKKIVIFYCRPCEVAAFSTVNWNGHLESIPHRGKMNDKRFRNFTAICQLCNFELVASDVIASRYCGFHIETCHSTKDVHENMKLVEVTPSSATNAAHSFKQPARTPQPTKEPAKSSGSVDKQAQSFGPPPKPAWPPQKPAWQTKSAAKELFGNSQAKAAQPLEKSNGHIEETTFPKKTFTKAVRPSNSPSKESVWSSEEVIWPVETGRQGVTKDSIEEQIVEGKTIKEPVWPSKTKGPIKEPIWPSRTTKESIWAPMTPEPAKQPSRPSKLIESSTSDQNTPSVSRRFAKVCLEEIDSWPLC